MKILKSSDKILNICSEKNENLLNDKSIDLKEFVGKKYTNDEYIEIVNSIKYGKIERLGEDNCLNKNCIEYYPKGNFTTVSFYEFNDDGIFVKFNRIGFGKLYNISNYDNKDLKEYYLKKIEIKINSHYLSPELKATFIKVMEKVASAYKPVTIDEVLLLEKFKADIEPIHGDPVYYKK